MEEIEKTAKEVSLKRCQAPDGFTAGFYQSFKD